MRDIRELRNERFVILLASLATIGVLIETILMKWELWVLPIGAFGIIGLWIVHTSSKFEQLHDIRILYYFFFGVLVMFFHGVHAIGLWDIALVASLVMATYATFDQIYMLNILLTEYFIIVFYHIWVVPEDNSISFENDKMTAFRLLLQAMVVLFVYFINLRFVNERLEASEIDKEKDVKIEAYDADMEDFLSNISHELRTPVNVVNGMSDLLIKRNVGYEADAIKNAGIRLAYQIEDIQDYTECKRDKVILEEEDYMSISLINDVVTGFRLLEHEDLELVVDLDPKVPAKMTGDIKKLHKIFRHLLENAVKFTRQGGVNVRMYTEPKEYGVNLCIEMTDTGIGMDRKALQSVADGMYQVNKKRNRSSGGIGLGLYIVYGFAHRMGGFVKIESDHAVGTTVRVTVPQRVADATPCLALSREISGAVLFHVRSDKYKVPQLRDFYRSMAGSLASGIRVPLYSAETVYDVERMKEKVDASYIFMGEEEYNDNRGYFDALCDEDIIVVVSANEGFSVNEGSKVIVMPKPLYAYPVIKLLNEGRSAGNLGFEDDSVKPSFLNVKALIVDDEPMNLVVASGIFRDYGMQIDTAGGGREAIAKFRENDYDVVFMDHMMPEMDGVEAMKQIRGIAADLGKNTIIVALTANVVSGAREMFMREGFDGFIAKPISTSDFERVMLKKLPAGKIGKGGERA